jgi:hypothetical protein
MKKKEIKYPIMKQDKESGLVVFFVTNSKGLVAKRAIKGVRMSYNVGHYAENWIDADSDNWMAYNKDAIWFQPLDGEKITGLKINTIETKPKESELLQYAIDQSNMNTTDGGTGDRGTQSILIEADSLVNGQRQADYSDPIHNWTETAKCASLLTGKELSAADCVNVLIATKLMREAYKHKRDNLVDLAGYAEILNRVRDAVDNARP